MSGRHHEPPEVAVHEFVQLLAGWVPDESLAAVRGTLAGGQPAAAATAAVAMAADHEVPLLATDIQAARWLAGDPAALAGLEPAARYPRLPFAFSILGPDEALEADELDQAMARAARARRARIAGVSRAWRFPLAGPGELWAGTADADRAHRVYLVQVTDPAAAPALAGQLRADLDGHGDAGVEVIALNATPPPYQAAALDGAALVWADEDGEPPFRIAKVFDFARPGTGPGFHPAHRVITDAGEGGRLLRYLASGSPVLHATARTCDVLDPAAGPVVPTRFRTDGEWIWTDTVAYYLEQHRLAPDEELAAHIEARWRAGDTDAATDQETATEAANFLIYPTPERARQAAWARGADG
jgi:hypothetical protein